MQNIIAALCEKNNLCMLKPNVIYIRVIKIKYIIHNRTCHYYVTFNLNVNYMQITF